MATENRRSVATINSPEFINVVPENPTLSKCEIKVLYLGQNRNHSYITKEIATKMANSLPGCPIVGYFKKEKDDYRDHGEKVVIEGNEIYFECLTQPYGFVSPDAKVWFQDFEDTDDFGNVEVRTYMMTTGYLWTEQYEEAKKVINEGRPQSMELTNMDGEWSTDSKTGIDFFIINDATFSKLCILGTDVEPCFEGADITAPAISKSFSKMDDNFKNTLFTMMQELKMTIEGGQKVETEVNKEEQLQAPENFSAEEDKDEKTVETKSEEYTEGASEEDSFAKKDKDEDDDKKDPKDDDNDSKEDKDKSDDKKDEDDEDKKKKKDYSLLEQSYAELEDKYQKLESDFAKISEIAKKYELAEKDALIDSFTMLSEEDKKEVIDHKADYSLEEIESKLAVIGYRKKVNFNLEEAEVETNAKEEIEEPEQAMTFSFNSASTEPAWVKEVMKQSKNN